MNGSSSKRLRFAWSSGRYDLLSCRVLSRNLLLRAFRMQYMIHTLEFLVIKRSPIKYHRPASTPVQERFSGGFHHETITGLSLLVKQLLRLNLVGIFPCEIFWNALREFWKRQKKR